MRFKYLILFVLVALLSFLSIIYFNYSFRVDVHKVFIYAFNKITFKEKKYNKYQDKINKGYLSSKFGDLKFKKIKLEEKNFNVPLGYIEVFKNNILFMRADGNLILFDKNLKKKKIRNNIKDFFNRNLDANYDELGVPFIQNPIRDFFMDEGFLYVVILYKELIENKIGFTTVVLKGKLNLDYIEFDYFFKTNDFVYGKIDTWHSGGRIVRDEKNNFYISIPDYGKRKFINNSKKIFGKILKINSINDYEIISKGHRNPQGLYFDKDKNILLESEHGPSGGDEVNIIKKGKNYGFPSTSVGILKQSEDINEYYVKYHNHKKKGFEEPIYAWSPFSSGASQITKINKNSNFNFKNLYIVSTLSGKNKFVGNHLYLFEIKKNKAKIIDKIYVGDRIRDIHYDNINDRLIMTVENQESILIVSATDN